MPDTDNQHRLGEIAEQVNDGWVRCRGPLTGLKALQAARGEAEGLGASEDYLSLLDEILRAAKALCSRQSTAAYKDAPAIIEQAAPRLRRQAEQEAGAAA